MEKYNDLDKNSELFRYIYDYLNWRIVRCETDYGMPLDYLPAFKDISSVKIRRDDRKGRIERHILIDHIDLDHQFEKSKFVIEEERFRLYKINMVNG